MKVRIHRDELLKQFPDLETKKDYLVFTGEKIDNKRTLTQNRALHLLFTQLSDECMEKGIEMRDIVKDELPIECTPENIKWLWKKLQKALFKTQSTKELRNNGQIEVVYDNFNRIIVERTNGEISLPPFPCLDEQIKNIEKIDYPQSNGEPKF